MLMLGMLSFESEKEWKIFVKKILPIIDDIIESVVFNNKKILTVKKLRNHGIRTKSIFKWFYGLFDINLHIEKHQNMNNSYHFNIIMDALKKELLTDWENNFYKSIELNIEKPKKIKVKKCYFKNYIKIIQNAVLLSEYRQDMLPFRYYVYISEENKKYYEKFNEFFCKKEEIEIFTFRYKMFYLPVKNNIKSDEIKIRTKFNLDINIHEKITQIKKIYAYSKNLDQKKHLLNLLCYYHNKGVYINYTISTQRYYQTKEVNEISLIQNQKKEFRNFILEGAYQYDIQAAAPSILSQLYEKITGEKLHEIQNYTTHRTEYRKNFAKYIAEKKGESNYIKYIPQVKEVLNALIYGTKLKNPRSKIEMDFEDKKLLEKNKTFKKLANEINLILNIVYNKLKENKNENYYYLNDIKIPINDSDNKKRKKESVVAEVYFALERKILDLAIQEFKDKIILLLHDAFITNQPIDIKNFEKKIFDTFQYKILYDEEIIQNPYL